MQHQFTKIQNNKTQQVPEGLFKPKMKKISLKTSKLPDLRFPENKTDLGPF